MTTLLAYNDPVCGIYMAADRRMTMNTTDIGCDTFDKFVAAGPWLVQVAGSGATLDVLNDAADKLSAAATISDLTGCMRSLFLDSGWQPKSEDGSRGSFDSGFLVSDGHRLWKIFTNLGRYVIEPGRLARGGCGGDYALGAATLALPPWSALPKDSPERHQCILAVLDRAIRIAISYDTCSGGEPDVRRHPKTTWSIMPPSDRPSSRRVFCPKCCAEWPSLRGDESASGLQCPACGGSLRDMT